MSKIILSKKGFQKAEKPEVTINFKIDLEKYIEWWKEDYEENYLQLKEDGNEKYNWQEVKEDIKLLRKCWAINWPCFCPSRLVYDSRSKELLEELIKYQNQKLKSSNALLEEDEFDPKGSKIINLNAQYFVIQLVVNY